MPETIRFIAVDDNLLDLAAVTTYASAYPILQNCGAFSNIGDVLSTITILKPDLIFLDVEMPGLNGVDLLKTIKDHVTMSVFVTSYPEYAIDGFELSALDYVLKPLTEERFAKTIKRVQEFWEMKQKAAAYEVLFEKEYLTIKEGYNKIKLQLPDVIYLEAMQDYTKVVTEQKKYMTNISLSSFMQSLPEGKFIRIHRSYAVLKTRIKELHHAEVIIDNFSLPIGKTYRSAMGQIKL